MDTLQDWLNAELQKRGWSFRETARQAGLSAAMVGDVINGKANPGYEFCVKIGRALDVPAEDVMRRAGLLPKPPGWNPKVGELLGLAAGLPDVDQDELIAMARLKLERLRREQRGK